MYIARARRPRSRRPGWPAGSVGLALILSGAFGWFGLPPSRIARAAESSPTAPQPALQVGDPAPPLIAEEWVRGGPPRLLTEPDRGMILVFFASWCPSSRAALPLLDSLAARAPDRVQFVALTHEAPAATVAWVKQSGIRHLIVGSDPSRRWVRDWFDPLTEGERRSRVFPFAVIVGSYPARGTGTILWAGPLLEQSLAEPLAPFSAVLESLQSSSLQVSDAIRMEQAIDRLHFLSQALTQQLQATADAPGAAVLDSLVSEFDRLESTPQMDAAIVHQMNRLAWGLVTRDDRTEARLAVARHAVEIARSRGGDLDANLVDTRARVLFESGRLAEACEVQRHAVELARGTGTLAQFTETLRTYQAAAGLPVDSPAVLSPGAASTEPLAWSGNLNAAGERSDSLPVVLVAPLDVADTAQAGAWRREMVAIRDRFYPGARICSPGEVTEDDRLHRNLALYGHAADNPLVREMLAKTEVELHADGVVIAGVRVPADDPILIIALPNPWQPEHPLRLYTSARAATAHRLNRFFHGGTSLVVGRWEGAEPKVLASLDLKPRAREGSPVARLAIGPEDLSAEEALADLRALDSLLVNGYAGYPDLDWQERSRGRSWTARRLDFEERLRSQARWAATDFFDLLAQFLEPVQDHHFRMRYVGPRAGVLETRRTGFIRRVVPHFADARVVVRNGQRHLVGTHSGPPAGEGVPLWDQISVVGTPDEVTEGVTYLFPTLPRAGGPGPEEGGQIYLLGRLAPEEAAPESLSVRVGQAKDTGGGGAPVHELRLATHRGRMRSSSIPAGAWRLLWPPEMPLPTLEVRTMDSRQLEQLPASADTLRGQPHLLLDLRGNGGGSDAPAIAWSRRLSGQPFDWISSVQVRPGERDPLRRYATNVGSRLAADVIFGPDDPVAGEPYGGRLAVLVDKNVASSGETFTQLAAQIRGAILVGENTAGCVDYGNVEVHPALPHSGILCAFGRTRFIEDWVRSSREGVGFFPEYWLDDEDAAARVAEWILTPAGSR